MAWQDLATLYRGEPWFGPTANALQASKEIPTLAKIAGLDEAGLNRLGGKWWTANPEYAKQYAGGTGKVKSIQLKPGDIEKINKFGQKVTTLPSGKYRFLGLGNPPGSQNQYVLPESILKNRATGVNIGQTLKSLGAHYGGQGLRYGAQGLGYLASLPGQAGLMTVAPTHLGAEDMPTGDAEQEYFDYYNQYGDNYGDLKIPGWRKRKMDKLATQKGIDQVGMQKQIQDAGGVGVAPRRITPIHAPHPDRGGRDFQPQRPTRPGGFTDPGKGSYGPWKAGGGLIDNPLPGRSRYM